MKHIGPSTHTHTHIDPTDIGIALPLINNPKNEFLVFKNLYDKTHFPTIFVEYKSESETN